MRRRHSTHSPGVGLCLDDDVRLPHVVPDHHETFRVGVGEGTDQHGIDGAEHRRRPADAERERRDRDGRERGIAPDLTPAVTDIAPGRVEPSAMPAGPHVLFRLLEPPTWSIARRRASAGVAPLRTRSAAAISTNDCSSSFSSVSALSRRDDPAHDRRQAMQDHHAPSSTLVTAKETRLHRSRCCSSWRLPAAVRR